MKNHILEMFLHQVSTYPNHIAVSESGVETTYSELGKLAYSMALKMRDITPKARVLIHLNQGALAYASMFATWINGGYYSALNIQSTIKKKKEIFKTLRPDLILDKDGVFTLEEYKVPIISDFKLIEGCEITGLEVPSEIAYVIFTSGSTGNPKGVVISISALENYIYWALKEMRVSQGDRWSQYPNIGFDLSVLDIFGALCGGATLIPFTSHRDRLMPALAIKEYKITIWNSVPSVIDLMVKANQLTSDNLKTVRLINFCGELLLKRHLDSIFASCPSVNVHNTYGPTEATVSCTILNIKNKSNYNTYLSGISIGSAIPGMKVFLINNDKVDCNEGEIVLSGPQLAKGYWKDPDCSSNSFKVINVKGKMTRVYFTGDWGVVKKGDIFFSSRIDSQVKINGYRVELGEVEAALELCGVTSCCLMVDHELHAYIEPGLVKFDEHYVRASLGEYIESYAMPMYFHILDSLPRNENDKIDRKYLIKNRGGL